MSDSELINFLFVLLGVLILWVFSLNMRIKQLYQLNDLQDKINKELFRAIKLLHQKYESDKDQEEGTGLGW